MHQWALYIGRQCFQFSHDIQDSLQLSWQSMRILMRSGVAVVTEVGNIQARGEPAVLASLGISEHEYLLMPRLLGFAMSGLILTFVFAFIAIWFGELVSLCITAANG